MRRQVVRRRGVRAQRGQAKHTSGGEVGVKGALWMATGDWQR